MSPEVRLANLVYLFEALEKHLHTCPAWNCAALQRNSVDPRSQYVRPLFEALREAVKVQKVPHAS
jgi:hypothetical protein